MVGITSDADLPPCLNTRKKQIEKAKQLAIAHTGIVPHKAEGPRLQGFFSRTIFVTFRTRNDLVIQFRPEPLDLEPFQTAQGALGSVVPDIGALEDKELEENGIWTYWMTRISGKTWLEGVRGTNGRALVTINRSLGRILSRGFVESRSDEVIEERLRPHLEILLGSKDERIQDFHDVARDLLGKLDKLASLPLFVSHFDLNEVNVMLNDDFQVSGIIDWELSTPLPFGMGFCRIHTLAGEFSEQKFYMPPEFEDAERGFWQQIWDGISGDIRAQVEDKADAVQIAVTLGTLLDTFQLTQHKKIAGYNPVAVEALPKLLSYRIPLVRGPDIPYLDQKP